MIEDLTETQKNKVDELIRDFRWVNKAATEFPVLWQLFDDFGLDVQWFEKQYLGRGTPRFAKKDSLEAFELSTWENLSFESMERQLKHYSPSIRPWIGRDIHAYMEKRFAIVHTAHLEGKCGTRHAKTRYNYLESELEETVVGTYDQHGVTFSHLCRFMIHIQQREQTFTTHMQSYEHPTVRRMKEGLRLFTLVRGCIHFLSREIERLVHNKSQEDVRKRNKLEMDLQGSR